MRPFLFDNTLNLFQGRKALETISLPALKWNRRQGKELLPELFLLLLTHRDRISQGRLQSDGYSTTVRRCKLVVRRQQRLKRRSRVQQG